MFKSAKRGVVMGEPTYGSTGTPCTIPLRCGGRAQVVSVGYRLMDGTEFIGKGIMPDIKRDAASL
jgi:C-terminal processing protease CtpA/Prc